MRDSDRDLSPRRADRAPAAPRYPPLGLVLLAQCLSTRSTSPFLDLRWDPLPPSFGFVRSLSPHKEFFLTAEKQDTFRPSFVKRSPSAGPRSRH